jgi:hypothetical protein
MSHVLCQREQTRSHRQHAMNTSDVMINLRGTIAEYVQVIEVYTAVQVAVALVNSQTLIHMSWVALDLTNKPPIP